MRPGQRIERTNNRILTKNTYGCRLILPASNQYPIKHMHKNAIPLTLCAALALLILWSGIAPAERAVWYAEIIPIALVFAALVLTFPKFRFSNAAYLLMSCWLILHTIGAKYTFAAVPFDWGNPWLAPHFRRGAQPF